MADDDRFAGMKDQLEAEDGADTEDETEEAADTSAQESEETAAFSFNETEKKTIYIRPETLDPVLDDLEFEVIAQLRREHDIRDLTGREFHDAVLHVAANHPDEISTLIAERRG